MAEDYKATPHWQALNRIWKTLPLSAREPVMGDFQLLTELVKGKNDSPVENTPATATKKPEYDFETNYLRGMSRETKRFALRCLTQEHLDVYKGVSDFIVARKIDDMDMLWEGYTEGNAVPEGDEAALREIMCVCLERVRLQNSL